MISIVLAVWFALHPPPPPPVYSILPGEVPTDVSDSPRPTQPKELR